MAKKYNKDIKVTESGKFYTCGRVFDTFNEAFNHCMEKNGFDEYGWCDFFPEPFIGTDDEAIGHFISGNKETTIFVINDENRLRAKKGLKLLDIA